MNTPELLGLSPESLAVAAYALQNGQLVAFPTETVYGLGADATNESAIARLFALKERPQINPLIVHVAHADEADSLVDVDNRARQLMARFWPGPLTLILPRREDSPISLLCSAGLDTLAIRSPGHKAARDLIEAAGIPLAAPSANRSGTISPTTAQHVMDSFASASGDDLALVLAGGKCSIGLESTILDISCDVPVLLRPGAVLQDEIEETLGLPIRLGSGNAARPTAPGQLASHYAPKAQVRLDVKEQLAPGEAYLAFGQMRGLDPDNFRNLSPNGDLFEAAANLFAYLRELDGTAPSSIAVAPIPEVGLGLAINERLRRAAAPRANRE